MKSYSVYILLSVLVMTSLALSKLNLTHENNINTNTKTLNIVEGGIGGSGVITDPTKQIPA